MNEDGKGVLIVNFRDYYMENAVTLIDAVISKDNKEVIIHGLFENTTLKPSRRAS